MSGAAEWARQWLLLQRRAAYQGDGRHLLWMRCGGSAGHSSLWGVTIDEGQLDPETFTGRTWDVTVAPVADARAEAKHDQEARKAAEQEEAGGRTPGTAVDRAAERARGRHGPSVAGGGGVKQQDFCDGHSCLIQEGRAERCEITKKGATYDAYKPTGK